MSIKFKIAIVCKLTVHSAMERSLGLAILFISAIISGALPQVCMPEEFSTVSYSYSLAMHSA